MTNSSKTETEMQAELRIAERSLKLRRAALESDFARAIAAHEMEVRSIREELKLVDRGLMEIAAGRLPEVR